MIVTFTPDDGSPAQRWEFDPDQVRESRAEMIEKRYQGNPSTFAAWLVELVQGGARARRVLLWHLQSQDHPILRFEDVDPSRKQLKVEWSRDEVARMIDGARTNRDIPADQREQLVAKLEAELEAAPAGEGGGKAPSGRSGSGTPLPS